jgi:Holliday junction resolvase RusA-like endonuclease
VIDPTVFVVFGHPESKGSKRVLPVRKATGERTFAVADSNKNAKPWANRITEKTREIYDGPLLRGPVLVSLSFYFARPRGHFGAGRNAHQLKPSSPEHMTRMPDVDKLARCVLDALVGVLIADDAQVVTLQAGKAYGEPERVEIRIREPTT